VKEDLNHGGGELWRLLLHGITQEMEENKTRVVEWGERKRRRKWRRNKEEACMRTIAIDSECNL
jgi:hypothetical protein